MRTHKTQQAKPPRTDIYQEMFQENFAVLSKTVISCEMFAVEDIYSFVVLLIEKRCN